MRRSHFCMIASDLSAARELNLAIQCSAKGLCVAK
jgi:hypothetical protein